MAAITIRVLDDMGLGLEVAADSRELPSWYSGRNLGEDKSCAVTWTPGSF